MINFSASEPGRPHTGNDRNPRKNKPPDEIKQLYEIYDGTDIHEEDRRL